MKSIGSLAFAVLMLSGCASAPSTEDCPLARKDVDFALSQTQIMFPIAPKRGCDLGNRAPDGRKLTAESVAPGSVTATEIE